MLGRHLAPLLGVDRRPNRVSFEIGIDLGDESLHRVAVNEATEPASPREADQRGYRSLFLRMVLQADAGCDFDFLRATQFSAKAP